MSRLYVPVIINGDVSLFDVECNEHEDGLLINGNSPDEDAGIQTLADKAASFQKSFCGGGDASAQILISDRDREADAEIQFDDSTQSVTLGILVELYRCLNHGSYKDKWDYIVTTGDWSPKGNSVDSVDKITHKFEAVKELAREDPSKRIIFVYVDSGLPLETGYSKEFPNVFISGFKSGTDFREIKAEILAPEFSEEQEELLKKADRFSLENFYETETYLHLKAEIKKWKGFLIEGRSNSGKTALAGALARYAMEAGLVYAPLWITINNDEVREILHPAGESSDRFASLAGYLQKQIGGIIGRKDNGRYLLVIDNIELDFTDDIIYVLQKIINDNPCISFTVITSWSGARRKENLEKLNIKELCLQDSNKDDFDGIYQAIVKSYFSNHLQRATAEESRRLKELSYVWLKDRPGKIYQILDALNVSPVSEVISRLEGSGVSNDERESYFYNISLSQLDFFSQLVFYEFIALFGCENRICTGNDFEELLREINRDGIVDREFLFDAEIGKSLKLVASHYLIQESGSGDYSVKNDTLKYFLFYSDAKGAALKLKKKCVKVARTIQAAISYDWKENLKEILNQGLYPPLQTLWSIARYAKSPDFFDVLLGEKDIDINARNEDGLSALHIAVKDNPNLAILKYLASKSDCAMLTDNGNDILHLAVENPNPDILKYILEEHLYDDLNSTTRLQDTQLRGIASMTSIHKWLELADTVPDVPEKTKQAVSQYLDDAKKKYCVTPLISAARLATDVKVFELLEDAGVSLTGEAGKEALLEASAFNSNLEIIKLLINRIGTASVADEKGHTLLHQAAKNPELSIVEYILREHLYDGIDGQDASGFTPILIAASENPNPGAIDLLLESGADWHKTVDGRSLLLCAAGGNNHLVVEYILEKKLYDVAKDNLLRKGKYTLLHWAAGNPDLSVIQFVYENNLVKHEDIDKKDENGFTPLLLAAKVNSNIEVLKYLISKGASYREKTDDNETVLLCAAQNNNPEILKYVLQEHLFANTLHDDIRARTKKDGYNALMLAVRKNRGLETFKMLVDVCGFDVNCISKNGENLLNLAIYAGDNDVARYLIERSWPLTFREKLFLVVSYIGALFGKSYEAKRGLYYVQSDFRYYHRKIDEAYGRCQTALEDAIATNNLDIVKLLRKYGANFNRSYFSALDWACTCGSPDIVRYIYTEKLYKKLGEHEKEEIRKVCPDLL